MQRSSSRSSIGQSVQAGPSYFTKQQMGDYLKDLRTNPPQRPNGARAMRESPTRLSKDRNSIISRPSISSNSNRGLSHSRSSSVLSYYRTGDSIVSGRTSPDRMHRPYYVEREQRQYEKAEAQAVRAAIEQMDFEDEQRILSAAKQEANELIRQQEIPKDPYWLDDEATIRLQQSPTKIIPTTVWAEASPDSYESPRISQSAAPVQSQHDSSRRSSNPFSLSRLSNRRSRAFSRTKQEPAAGKENVYEDRAASRSASPEKVTSSTLPTAAARKNPFARARNSMQNMSLATARPRSELKTTPSQSRGAYTYNTLVGDSVAKGPARETTESDDEEPVKYKDGMEVRSDDIRAATSKKMSNRSPRLPSPTVVSDDPGRPIVSFQKDWSPPPAEPQNSMTEPHQDFQSAPRSRSSVMHRISPTGENGMIPRSDATAIAPIQRETLRSNEVGGRNSNANRIRTRDRPQASGVESRQPHDSVWASKSSEISDAHENLSSHLVHSPETEFDRAPARKVRDAVVQYQDVDSSVDRGSMQSARGPVLPTRTSESVPWRSSDQDAIPSQNQTRTKRPSNSPQPLSPRAGNHASQRRQNSDYVSEPGRDMHQGNPSQVMDASSTREFISSVPEINVSPIQNDRPSRQQLPVRAATVPSVNVSEGSDDELPDNPRIDASPSFKSQANKSIRPPPRHAATDPPSARQHWSPAEPKSPALCSQCALPIKGRTVSAAGIRFHPECFKCHYCSQRLESVGFYPEPTEKRDERIDRINRRMDGEDVQPPEGTSLEDDEDDSLRFYCHLDFHELFSPRCKSCKTPIEGEVIVACGAEWHVGHFFCAQCGDPFDPSTPFVEKDGYAWCVKCHMNRFSGKCIKCRQPITQKVLQALGKDWHPECFCCLECGHPISGGKYFLRGEKKEAVCQHCEERRLKS